MILLKRVSTGSLVVIFGFVLAEIILRVAGISFPIFDAYDYDRALKLMPGKEGRYDKEGEWVPEDQ